MCGITGQLKCFGKVEVIFANVSEDAAEDTRKKSQRVRVLARLIRLILGEIIIASGKEPACQSRRHNRFRFDPWLGKIPRRRKWQPTPAFLPR